MKRVIYKSFAALVIAILTAAVPAHAEEIPPEDVQVYTPAYHPSMNKIDFPEGTYQYTVSWQGIPAAECSISVNQEGLRYKIQAAAKTYSGIDLLYKLRYQADGLLSAVDFLPIRTEIYHQENSKIRNIEINYEEDGDISTIRAQQGKDTKSLTFNPQNLTLDPFSAAFIARGLDWQVGKTAEFDTFNGKTRYLIQLTAVDKVQMNINEEMRDVWIISPRVRRLTNTEADKKLREAFIYLTADKDREIIQIVSEVFIGSVKTKLDSFTPSSNVMKPSMAKNVQPIRWIF